MAPTIILISGANRGLGKELLQLYLAKPNHTVIAANRDPGHATSKALAELPASPGSRLVVVKTDASVESDPFEAVKQLAAQGIDRLDVVIANAGIAYAYPKVSELKIADLQAHITTNVFGVVGLYQATLPLLQKSTNPKWVTMGTGAAWLEASVLLLSYLGLLNPLANNGVCDVVSPWLSSFILKRAAIVWLLGLNSLPSFRAPG